MTTTNPSLPGRLRPVTLRRYWPALAIAVIVAVTAGVFVRGGRDEHVHARVGQTFDAQYAFARNMSISSRTLRLPYGEISIATTAPQRSAPAGVNDNDRLAPDNGSFIGVNVKSGLGVQLPQPAAADVSPPKVDVALVVGSRTYRIPPGFRSVSAERVTRFAWVAVAGSPRDVRVAVTYDGVTQSVDARTGTRTTGRAAPLYRVASLATRRSAKDCGPPVAISDGFRVDPDDDIRCQVQTVGALPYLPGRGWAPAGKTWSTVLVGLFDDAHFILGRRLYRARSGGSGPVVTARTTGGPAATPPMVTPTAYLPAGANGRLAVFATPTGSTPPITLSAGYSDLVAYGGAQKHTVVTGPRAEVTWKVTP